MQSGGDSLTSPARSSLLVMAIHQFLGMTNAARTGGGMIASSP